MIANQLIKDVVVHTPLQRNDVLSERYECNIYLKREDLQVVRSFKIRGAYNRIKKLSPEELENGIALCKCRKPRTRCSICVPSFKY